MHSRLPAVYSFHSANLPIRGNFQKQRVHIRYSPRIGDNTVKQEAVQVIRRTLEARAKEERKQELLREKQEADEEEVSFIVAIVQISFVLGTDVSK